MYSHPSEDDHMVQQMVTNKLTSVGPMEITRIMGIWRSMFLPSRRRGRRMMKDITKVLSLHHVMSNPPPLALAVVNQEKKDTGIRQTHRVIPGLETQLILPP